MGQSKPSVFPTAHHVSTREPNSKIDRRLFSVNQLLSPSLESSFFLLFIVFGCPSTVSLPSVMAAAVRFIITHGILTSPGYKLLLFLSSRRFTRVLAGLIKVSRQREYFENPELQTWSWLTQGRPESEPANRFFGEDSEKKCKITPSRTPLVQRFKSALPDMALSSLFCELNRHFQRENYISIFWHSLVWMNFEVLICNKLLHIICNLKNKDRKWDNSLLTFIFI